MGLEKGKKFSQDLYYFLLDNIEELRVFGGKGVLEFIEYLNSQDIDLSTISYREIKGFYETGKPLDFIKEGE